MKSLFILIMAFITVVTFGATKPANYAGKWTLDMKQSKNLPPYYNNVQSHKLFISQDEKNLKVDVEVKAGGDDAPNKMNFVYNFDGSESKTETSIKTPNGLINVPATLKALVADDGKLKITISREMKMGDKTINASTVEDWKLSQDGRTLSIHRADDTPRGKMEMDMVFVKD